MGNPKCVFRKFNNGHPHDFVLAFFLLGLYIADIPNTQKFRYADDWPIPSQHQDFEEIKLT